MEGPGLGHRGREASLCNPTGFQVGSGADRESLGVGRIPVYQWRSPLYEERARTRFRRI